MDKGSILTNRAQEQISLYLDHALDPEQEQEFLQQIDSNPILNNALEKEKHFRSVIRNNFGRPKLEPDFIQLIKNKIH